MRENYAFLNVYHSSVLMTSDLSNCTERMNLRKYRAQLFKASFSLTSSLRDQLVKRFTTL